MAKIYFRKIKSGDLYLSNVPERWQSSVEAMVLKYIETPEGAAWLQEHPDWHTGEPEA